MNIQVINFEINKEHYVITRMLKTTKNNHIEYLPSHCYKKGKEVDCYILITRQKEHSLLDWCQLHDLPLEKCIIFNQYEMNQFIHWVGVNIFDKDVDFEKMCQFMMCIREENPEIDFFTNCQIRSGKIKKEHDYDLCVQSILKQNPNLPKDSMIFLFVKEKSNYLLPEPECKKINLYQYSIRGVSETYDYLLINERN